MDALEESEFIRVLETRNSQLLNNELAFTLNGLCDTVVRILGQSDARMWRSGSVRLCMLCECL